MKLFVDKISHPSRFCLQFCKLNKIKVQEIHVNLLKGQNKTHSELPLMKQIPVLKCNQLTISQSTTILRFLAQTKNVPEDFFPRKCPEKSAEVNEFMDFFHFSLNSVKNLNFLFNSFLLV